MAADDDIISTSDSMIQGSPNIADFAGNDGPGEIRWKFCGLSPSAQSQGVDVFNSRMGKKRTEDVLVEFCDAAVSAEAVGHKCKDFHLNLMIAIVGFT